MSENAFAAAMRPKSYGSSTMGVKKSTVATIARSGATWMTAASSRLEASTRIRGSVATGTWRKTCASSAGPSLQAQPAPCEKRVNRIAVMGAVDIGSTEDTLSESPGENGAGDDVAGQICAGADEERPARGLVRACAQPRRNRRERADEEEHEPPAAAAERVEPQRREQREQGRFDDAPLRRWKRDRAPHPRLTAGLRERCDERRHPARRDQEPGGHRQPREDQPRERHPEGLATVAARAAPGARSPARGARVPVAPP